MGRLNRILLVDDDETSNFLNEFLIKGMEVVEEVFVATNGQEALDFIYDQKEVPQYPQLIFLDINMPVMDGFEFLEEFENIQQQLSKKVPVYVLTSSNYFKDFERAKAFSVTGYIIKPLTEEKIREALNKTYNTSGV